MVDYNIINKMAPYVPYAPAVIGSGIIIFTGWYLSRKDNKLLDEYINKLGEESEFLKNKTVFLMNNRDESELKLEERNNIAERITKESQEFHDSVQNLSEAVSSIKHPINELTDFLKK